MIEHSPSDVAFDTTSAEYQQAHRWMLEEAQLLDSRRYREWLDVLSLEIVYRMPVRITVPHSLDESLLGDMDHFDEDYYSLTKRIERFETEHAWTEDPPSRTRHFITNVQVFAGDVAEELRVTSYLLLFRSRGDVRAPDLLSAERLDVLRAEGSGLKLLRRLILVDEAVLRTQNMAVFLQTMNGNGDKSLELANEYAAVIVRRVHTRNGVRLEIDSPRLQRAIRLCPIALESLTWQSPETFSEFLRTPFGPEGDVE